MNIEFAGVDWLMHGWLLTLAFTAAVLVVAALRKPCRRLFGTERAFQLWLLPPLALLASLLPHATNVGNRALPSLVYAITSAGDVLSSRGGGLPGIEWRHVIVSIWCVGSAIFLLLAAASQWRYRCRLLGAMPRSELRSRYPVVRAISADVGPALVGAWRVRIVLPVDFEDRYDAAERALILAHEVMHAHRRDGLWCLLAQPVVALFWFHPLAWWALSALRHDQELACDAAVLREHGAQRRSYAHAMLKTQSAQFALPVGCPWSPRHPLTERIAMLKQSAPKPLQTRLGLFAGVVLGAIVTGAVYAASGPSGAVAMQSSPAAAAGEYQLDIKVASFSKGTSLDHAERTTGGICMAQGEPGGVNTDKWQLVAKVMPLDHGRVSVVLDLNTAAGKPIASRQLQGLLGQPLLAQFKNAGGEFAYSIDVTPLAGCPARVEEVVPPNV